MLWHIADAGQDALQWAAAHPEAARPCLLIAEKHYHLIGEHGAPRPARRTNPGGIVNENCLRFTMRVGDAAEVAAIRAARFADPAVLMRPPAMDMDRAGAAGEIVETWQFTRGTVTHRRPDNLIDREWLEFAEPAALPPGAGAPPTWDEALARIAASPIPFARDSLTDRHATFRQIVGFTVEQVRATHPEPLVLAVETKHKNDAQRKPWWPSTIEARPWEIEFDQVPFGKKRLPLVWDSAFYNENHGCFYLQLNALRCADPARHAELEHLMAFSRDGW